jgi:hypothetical protein
LFAEGVASFDLLGCAAPNAMRPVPAAQHDLIRRSAALRRVSKDGASDTIPAALSAPEVVQNHVPLE